MRDSKAALGERIAKCPSSFILACPYRGFAAFHVLVSYCKHGFCLKRLASAVQLRPWPPYSKELGSIASVRPGSALSLHPGRGARRPAHLEFARTARQ